MRYNPDDTKESAGAIINCASQEELERIFSEYGEERMSRRIALCIVKARKRREIRTTEELADIVGRISLKGRIHPATRIFQALRISVNNELYHAERGIQYAIRLLVPGGRVAVISFHSLEDRIVKNLFRSSSHGSVLTKKPVTATPEEVHQNPRSRSAKLRAFIKHS